MKNKILVFLMLLGVFIQSSFAGGGVTDDGGLSLDIHKILIESKICSSWQDCTNKDVMFGTGGGVIGLTLYGITDMDLIGRIVHAAFMHRKKKAGSEISITFYPESKSYYFDRHIVFMGRHEFVALEIK